MMEGSPENSISGDGRQTAPQFRKTTNNFGVMFREVFGKSQILVTLGYRVETVGVQDSKLRGRYFARCHLKKVLLQAVLQTTEKPPRQVDYLALLISY